MFQTVFDILLIESFCQFLFVFLKSLSIIFYSYFQFPRSHGQVYFYYLFCITAGVGEKIFRHLQDYLPVSQKISGIF